MWNNDMDWDTKFLEGTVESFLKALTKHLDREDIIGVSYDDINLQQYKDTKDYKVAYFNIDDRDYGCSENEVMEESLKSFCKDMGIKYTGWDRLDAYLDGTASYGFYFSIQKYNKKETK